MSDQTIEAPPAFERPASPRREAARRRERSFISFAQAYPWVFWGAALLVFSLIVVLWARARPGYDPYGWLVWGKLSIRGALDTNGAPSWKPLPFLFTVPYAIFGHYQLWLWMVTSIAISLCGPIFAWRIAFRLTPADPARRYAAYVAGLFAAAFVLGMQDPLLPANYVHYILSAESDTMIVALVLAAIDCHLNGRHRWAFWIWWLGSLGRPEVWPFWLLAGAWLWRSDPTYRRWLVFSVLFLLFMWFGIPGLTSKSVFTAANVAQNSARECHGNKVTCTLTRYHELHANPIWILAGLSVVWAAWRRNLLILALTAGALAWLIIEVALAIKGFPGVPRYMFESGAVVAILAGIFIGRLILAVPPRLSVLLRRVRGLHLSPRLSTQLAGWATGLLVLVIAGSLLPAAHRQFRLERADLREQRARTVLIGRMSGVIKRLGAAHILACGQPNIPIEYQSTFAFYTDVKIGELYVSQNYERLHPHPLVNMYPIAGAGWKVFPSDTDAASAARCSGLTLVYH
ncbi:MAG TPA: hypothetical protein VMD09_16685 [Solirubrobacteraceae bacterium]|nr:hypothetical protein [Solirubrobacteraceae bacterium]